MKVYATISLYNALLSYMMQEFISNYVGLDAAQEMI